MVPQLTEKHMFQTPKTGLLIVLLFTACEESEDAVGRQGSGSCWEDYDTYSGCIIYYGELDMPENESSCQQSGGEWSDEACPNGFDARCDTEIYAESGFETYYYDMSDKAFDSNELFCDALGGIWYE
jgi:hypothetical protein